MIRYIKLLVACGQLSVSFADVVELVDSLDLGAVTLVKVFPVPLDFSQAIL